MPEVQAVGIFTPEGHEFIFRKFSRWLFIKILVQNNITEKQGLHQPVKNGKERIITKLYGIQQYYCSAVKKYTLRVALFFKKI